MKELKSEISRLARKEAKQVVAPVKKVSANYRGPIAGLRKQIDALQGEVGALRRGREGPGCAGAPRPLLDHWQGRQGDAEADGFDSGYFRKTGRRQCPHGRQLGRHRREGRDSQEGNPGEDPKPQGQGEAGGGGNAGGGQKAKVKRKARKA